MPEKKENREEILLGIDYGDKRTGLAFGRSGLASPLKIISARDENVVISEIARVVLENRVTKLLMGLPKTHDGKETQQSLKTRRFAKLLKVRLKRPLEFVDEYDTSKEAVEYAIRSGVSQKRTTSFDDISAAVIIKRYYSEHEV